MLLASTTCLEANPNHPRVSSTNQRTQPDILQSYLPCQFLYVNCAVPAAVRLLVEFLGLLMRRAEKEAPSCEETALGPSRGRMRTPLQSVSHFARSHDPGAGPRPWPLLQIRRAAVTVYDKLAFLCSVIFLPAYDKFESLEMRS